MKLPYAHVSRSALAVVAAAGAVWLSAFFLPGAGVAPAPLLPAIGSVAGKVVAVAEPHHHAAKPAAAPRRTIAAPALARAPFLPPASVPEAVQPKPRAVQRPHRTNRRHPAARPKHSAPVQTAAPAPASSPAPATTASVSSTAAPRGKAVGWHRKHELSTGAPAAAPTQKHGKSHAKHEAPPAEPVAPPAPTPATPAAPPVSSGHDNGKHVGDEHGHGDHGHGPGGKK
jgi:hypothetical protein